MNKKLYIFFSLTSFAYMLSVSVYLLNSFIMLNDTIFAVTRILMICCLLIFLLFGLKLKTIAKIEGNNKTLTKFQHIQYWPSQNRLFQSYASYLPTAFPVAASYHFRQGLCPDCKGHVPEGSKPHSI